MIGDADATAHKRGDAVPGSKIKISVGQEHRGLQVARITVCQLLDAVIRNPIRDGVERRVMDELIRDIEFRGGAILARDVEAQEVVELIADANPHKGGVGERLAPERASVLDDIQTVDLVNLLRADAYVAAQVPPTYDLNDRNGDRRHRRRRKKIGGEGRRGRRDRDEARQSDTLKSAHDRVPSLVHGTELNRVQFESGSSRWVGEAARIPI